MAKWSKKEVGEVPIDQYTIFLVTKAMVNPSLRKMPMLWWLEAALFPIAPTEYKIFKDNYN